MSLSIDSSSGGTETDTETDVSTRVIECVSSNAEIPLLDLPPLNDVMDPDALNQLYREQSSVTVAFDYAGHSVTIHPDSTIDVRTIE